MKSPDTALGQRLRELRLKRGMTQKELAGDTITTLSTNWKQHHFDPNFSLWMVDQNKNFVWDPNAAKAEQSQASTAQNKYIDRIMTYWMEADDDSYSGHQKAAKTTVNAICMTGMMPSLTPEVSGNSTEEKVGQDEYYSGGMENTFRWIERWDNVPLIFNGTILCLYSPHEPEYRWKPKGYNGIYKSNYYQNYYNPPLRTSWAYRRMTPPGLPNFFSVRETEWDRVAWSSVNWGGGG